jgi:hypothetical protein
VSVVNEARKARKNQLLKQLLFLSDTRWSVGPIKSAIRAVEKKRGHTEDDEKDTVMGTRLLSQQKTEEQQLQSPETVMFDSSDDLKVQARNYVSSSFSNEYTL